jgi:hypothetical protein
LDTVSSTVGPLKEPPRAMAWMFPSILDMGSIISPTPSSPRRMNLSMASRVFAGSSAILDRDDMSISMDLSSGALE